MRRTSYELTRCPVCDGADTREIADRDAIRAEVERLWAFHGRRLRPGIPPEHLMDRVAFSQDPPVRLVQCIRCRHVYRNPRERVEALDAAYAASAAAPEDDEFRELLETQRAAYGKQIARLAAVAGAHGRGLEVGSYVGGFLAAARDAGWDFTGVDVSDGAVAFASRHGLPVTRGTLQDVPTDRPFDAIAIWNTFEQLYDARSAALAARDRLRTGGALVVRVPNGGFYARWRRRLDGVLAGIAERLLAHNNLLGFPYRQGFTRRSMHRLLEAADFAVVHVVGDTLVPIADEWTTAFGSVDERVTKRVQHLTEREWQAPWVEVYARAV